VAEAREQTRGPSPRRLTSRESEAVKLLIVTLGQRMPDWINVATTTYLQRMPREFNLELVELKADGRTKGRSREQILTTEAEAVFNALGPIPFHALDERGSLWTTLELSHHLTRTQQEGESLGFVIGSADGLHPSILQRSRTPLGLSRMTLPHGLARVILVEQLYRAAMILKGHPYHRDT